jgi:hypothetical protein
MGLTSYLVTIEKQDWGEVAADNHRRKEIKREEEKGIFRLSGSSSPKSHQTYPIPRRFNIVEKLKTLKIGHTSINRFKRLCRSGEMLIKKPILEQNLLVYLLTRLVEIVIFFFAQRITETFSYAFYQNDILSHSENNLINLPVLIIIL